MYASTTIGYSRNVNQVQTGIVDYIPSSPVGFYFDFNQIDLGRLDYVTGVTAWYSDVLIDQASGWTVNWELINMPWETIKVKWEL